MSQDITNNIWENIGYRSDMNGTIMGFNHQQWDHNRDNMTMRIKGPVIHIQCHVNSNIYNGYRNPMKSLRNLMTPKNWVYIIQLLTT
jgi:hypothetical protein